MASVDTLFGSKRHRPKIKNNKAGLSLQLFLLVEAAKVEKRTPPAIVVAWVLRHFENF